MTAVTEPHTKSPAVRRRPSAHVAGWLVIAAAAGFAAAAPASGVTTVAGTAAALAGTAVTVECVDLTTRGWWGAAELGGSRIQLDHGVCASLAAAPRLHDEAGRGPSSGASVLTLAHEVGHIRGIANERRADCFAKRSLRRVALALGYQPAQLARLHDQARAASTCRAG